MLDGDPPPTPMSETASPPRKPRDDEMDVFGLSHAGLVRKENQDHYLMATFHKRINVIRKQHIAPAAEDEIFFIRIIFEDRLQFCQRMHCNKLSRLGFDAESVVVF